MPRQYGRIGSGMPVYFAPMLADIDREATYSQAILGMLVSLKQRVPGNTCLRILDLGCGTGILGRHVLRHAKTLGMDVHVIFMDTNADMIAIAESNIAEDDLPRSTFFTGSTSGGRGINVFDECVDAIVSEILGTYSVSESMHKYLGEALRLLTAHKGVKHVIPVEATQFAEVFSKDVFESTDPENFSTRDYVTVLRATMSNLEDIAPVRVAYVNSQVDPIASVTIRKDVFVADEAVYEGQTLTALDVTKLTTNHFLAFGWCARLWDDVFLRSSLLHTNPARMQAWEIMICWLLPRNFEGSFDGSIQIKWPRTNPMPTSVALGTDDSSVKKLLRKLKDPFAGAFDDGVSRHSEFDETDEFGVGGRPTGRGTQAKKRKTGGRAKI